MTALTGGPSDTQLLTGTSRAPSADVPVPVRDTHLYGEQPGSGYKVPPSLVRRGDGQVLQLTPLLYAVLEAIDGTRDVHEIGVAASRVCGRTIMGDDVRQLVDGQLRPLGLVLPPDGSEPELKKADPLLGLRPRFVVSTPKWTRRLTAPFALLFNPVLVVVATIAFAVLSFWVLFEKGLASATYDAFRRPGMLLAVFAITVVSAGFHEFGHAAALRRGGGTPGAMGAGLYLVWPAFYTDVTDSYRLPRRARLRTDLGGLYFNALVALGMYGLWLASGWDGLLLVIAAQILQMIRQLPPIVRFDGYHILADITGVPDLFHRIGPTLRSFLPRRWRPDNARELKLWARIVVTLWVVLVVPILLVTVLLLVVTLPRILATSWDALKAEADQFGAHLDGGSFASASVDALAILALAVPVAGILYILFRLVRRLVTSAWQRTAGKPAKRGALVVGLFAMLAGLAFAWGPGQGNYDPISPDERGTLLDARPLDYVVESLGVDVDEPAARFAPSLVAGEQKAATTIWPASGGALPTKAEPALAVVMSPRDPASTEPTWVFPFNRPDAPDPGDNQAMAIVTEDGGTVYDVAFAMVWADEDTVLNSNEAYAFASCFECRAVAVSFQVVVVLGEANLVAPENVAAAVNYNCIRCVTEALAVQLVVSAPEGMSEDAVRQLEELWTEIAAFGGQLQGLTFEEIQARLEDYEREIVEIVDPEAADQFVAPIPSQSSSPDGSTSPSTSSEPEPSATGTGSATPSPSRSGDASQTPSRQPSPTTTEEAPPTVTPSASASSSA